MDAVIPPPPRKAPEGQRPQTAITSGGRWPEESRPEESRKPQQVSSRADLEQRRVTDDPGVLEDDQQVEVEDLGPEIEEDEQEQRNPLDPGDLASQITVRRPRSMPIPVIHYKRNQVLKILKLQKQLERKNLQAAYIWGIYLRMQSFIRTSL